MPNVGKGEYRKLIMRVPGFGKSAKQVNSGLLLSYLSLGKKRSSWCSNNERVFGKISKVPGVGFSNYASRNTYRGN